MNANAGYRRAVLTARQGGDVCVLTTIAPTSAEATALLLQALRDDQVAECFRDGHTITAGSIRWDEPAAAVTWTRPRHGLTAWASVPAHTDWHRHLTASVRRLGTSLVRADETLSLAAQRLWSDPGATVVFPVRDATLTLRVVEARPQDAVNPHALLLASWLPLQRPIGSAIELVPDAIMPFTDEGSWPIDPSTFRDALAERATRAGEPSFAATLLWTTGKGSGAIHAHHAQPALALADVAHVMALELPLVRATRFGHDARARQLTLAWRSRSTRTVGRLLATSATSAADPLLAERDAVAAAFRAVRKRLFARASRLLDVRPRRVRTHHGDVDFELVLHRIPAARPPSASWLSGAVTVPRGVIRAPRRRPVERQVATLSWDDGCYAGELRVEGAGRLIALRALRDALAEGRLPAPEAVLTPGLGVTVQPPSFPRLEATARWSDPYNNTRGRLTARAVSWRQGLVVALRHLHAAVAKLDATIADAQEHGLDPDATRSIAFGDMTFTLTLTPQDA